MMGILISVLTFSAVFLGIFTINLVLTDLFKIEQQQKLKEVAEELRVQVRQRARSTIDEQQEFLETIPDSPQYFSLIGLFQKFGEMTKQAGPNIDTKKLFLQGILISALLCVPVFIFTRSYVLIGAIVAIGAVFPVLYVSFKRQQRQNKLGQQLPDVLDLMSRVLRAGQTAPQALNAVADEFRDPVGTEFGLCYEQQNLGLSMDVALKQMAARTGLMELKIMVLAMLVQRQTGGNLAELLNKLSKVMRQRVEMKGMIRAMTAEGRMQAILLLGMPFVTWFVLYMLNPNYALKLFDHPVLIFSTASLMAIGALWIRKIVNFEY